jgi:hypothetical protein
MSMCRITADAVGSEIVLALVTALPRLRPAAVVTASDTAG